MHLLHDLASRDATAAAAQLQHLDRLHRWSRMLARQPAMPQPLNTTNEAKHSHHNKAAGVRPHPKGVAAPLVRGVCRAEEGGV